MTLRNLISAIFISVHLSILLVLLYVFLPLLFAVLSLILRGIFSHGAETNGIVAVAGGVREWVVMILIVAAILFTVVFILLERRSRRG
jgi:hypothetical protein